MSSTAAEKKRRVTGRTLTTGQVAQLCNVAPRTVAKWFDSGRLRGYRIPGSQDRRIPRESLVKFLKAHGLPLGELEEQQIVVVCSPDLQLLSALAALSNDTVAVLPATTAYTAGRFLEAQHPKVLVLDWWLGRAVCLEILTSVKLYWPNEQPRVLGIINEDTEEVPLSLETVRRPFDAAGLVERVRWMVEEEQP